MFCFAAATWAKQRKPLPLHLKVDTYLKNSWTHWKDVEILSFLLRFSRALADVALFVTIPWFWSTFRISNTFRNGCKMWIKTRTRKSRRPFFPNFLELCSAMDDDSFTKLLSPRPRGCGGRDLYVKILKMTLEKKRGCQIGKQQRRWVWRPRCGPHAWWGS